jgi:hypothetical protein
LRPNSCRNGRSRAYRNKDWPPRHDPVGRNPPIASPSRPRVWAFLLAFSGTEAWPHPCTSRGQPACPGHHVTDRLPGLCPILPSSATSPRHCKRC